MYKSIVLGGTAVMVILTVGLILGSLVFAVELVVEALLIAGIVVSLLLVIGIFIDSL